MDVGALLVYQNWHESMSDREMFLQETELGVLAERYGFDSVWAPEHHFDDYSMCPDNLQLMSYLAARTSRIKLGTAAVILPWNDPLRVVEKVTMLEQLSNGRTLFGMGRGLAKLEYEGFQQDMNASRLHFDEAADMIMRGLRDGYVENAGPVFEQPRVDVRPAPSPDTDWTDRIYGVAMSPDSVPAVARIGARMMTFIQYEAEKHADAINRYRDLYREFHQRDPAPVLTLDFVYCHEDPEVAERFARKYLSRYFLSVIKHYDFAGKHWRDTKGYEAYQVGADMIRDAGLENAAASFADVQVWGTPEQCVEKYRRRLEMLGPHEAGMALSFGGLPYEKVRASLQLLGERVVPELHRLTVPAAHGV